MRTCKMLLLATMITCAMGTTQAADWPGYRGPGGSGVSPETGLLKTWPAEGPKLLWTFRKAGMGYAGMAVVGGTLYTMGTRGDDEYLLAVNAKGEQVWESKMGPVHDWKANSWSRGPNSTPIVDGNMIYGLSSKGMLVCVEKSKGKQVWSLDLAGKLNGEVNDVGGGIEKFGWGYSWSPVVDGDQLIVVPGGSGGLIAGLNKKTGEVLWRSKEVKDSATYSSPVVATIGGVKQVIYLTQQTLYSVSAKDGSLLWSSKRDEPYPDVVCPSPIVKDNLVYVSVGYSVGNTVLEITGTGGKFKVAEKWTSKVIGNKQAGVTLVGKYVYGYHEDRNWACVEFDTGTLMWPKRRVRMGLKAGGFVVADGRIYTVDELGVVGLIEATPKDYKEISTFKLPETSKLRKSAMRLYSIPSLSDGKFFIRDQDLIFCYQVK